MSDNTDASFDALAITAALSERFDSASLAEVQAVAYLACLLSVYDGRPSAEWGYGFATTDTMTPFSPDLLAAMDRLRTSGLVDQDDVRYSLSPVGAEWLRRWAAMRRFESRRRYISGATGATDALPLPALSNGLRREPQIAASIAADSPRALLDDYGRLTLYQYFKTLEESLGPGSDLLIPAVVWLTFLLNEDETDLVAADGTKA
ncbi:hypothetical protein GCM10028799_15840 [Kribbella italica]